MGETTGGWLLGDQGSLSQLCVSVCAQVRLYQQCEHTWGLGVSYIQVPATGETGIQGPATGQTQVSEASCWRDPHCM